MLLTQGKLWIVATPIGNYGDLSPRARQILQEADLVLAEDTRRAMNMCAKCGIPVKNFTSFFEHNEQEKLPDVLKDLMKGQTICLVTDAGTPLLSDPGYRLVAECRKHSIPVATVPGPSAVIAALSISGLPPIPFVFLGFLPRAESGIRRLFKNFSLLSATLVFFERKDRLKQSLAIAHEILGSRKFAICRELTKIYEEVINGELDKLEVNWDKLAGELTIVIGPPAEVTRTPEKDVMKLLLAESAKGMKGKEAARHVKELVTGWQVSEIYGLLYKKDAFDDEN